MTGMTVELLQSKPNAQQHQVSKLPFPTPSNAMY